MTVTIPKPKLLSVKPSQLGKLLGTVLPPVVALVILLTIWQILCPEGSIGLPGHVQVWQETFDPYK